MHFHRTVARDTFRHRETRDGALWFHFDKVSVVYALKPTTITVPEGVASVCDMEGNALSVRPGETVEIGGQSIYLSR